MTEPKWLVPLVAFLLIALPVVGLVLGFAVPALQGPQDTKHLFVFGDSYSTTGFSIHGDAPSVHNPLGNPHFPGYTTSGGRNWVGYLIDRVESARLLTYNFAVSAATTDSSIVHTWAESAVDDQVDLFVQHVSNNSWTPDKALAIIWVGINDLGHPYWDEVVPPIDRVITRYAELLEILYAQGLRHYSLLTVPPFYKAPRFVGEMAERVEMLRQDIRAYNNGVDGLFKEFKASHGDVVGQVFNTTPSFETALSDPARFGAADASCVSLDGANCLWHDNYHPAVTIHRLLAEDLMASDEFLR
ncbi:GDSL-like Lipase/Acylhydrolase [Stachybotrys elegans]|uniref:GDSL-like Lipase/Acylhydrolase n=1 Tax=Stachybotrys elegans TaxID=80388 RepID=A0A8K0SWU4_9HYPO|nr:GDSL-like Lipase/Acylhydrolase [Stachybotrys elegans]